MPRKNDLAPVSLKTIAKQTGLSRMTVSRALRGLATASPETRKRVKAVAKKLGYRPNPTMVRLLHSLRGEGRRSAGALAYLWPDTSRREALSSQVHQAIFAGAKARAEAIGYTIDAFSWDEFPHIGAFKRVLQTRGIEGVVLAPVLDHGPIRLDLPWEDFAWAAIGIGLRNFSLSRVHLDHYAAGVDILAALTNRGYRRPCWAADEDVSHRMDHAWRGAFLTQHPAPKAAPHLFVSHLTNLNRNSLEAWLKEWSPDVFICDQLSSARQLKAALAACQHAAPVVLSHRTKHEQSFSGYDQDDTTLGANAIDLLTAQIYRNQKGLPEKPKKIVHRGQWIDASPAFARK